MTKRKPDGFEATIRDFVSSFHSAQIRKDTDFVKALSSESNAFATGYAQGLSAAFDKLKDAAAKNNIAIDQLGIESVSLQTLLDAAKDAREKIVCIDINSRAGSATAELRRCSFA